MRTDRLARLVVLALVILGAAPSAASAAEYYLKIPGVEGESTALRHEREIDVVSFSWGLVAESAPQAGRVRFNDLTVVKRVDASSPRLFQAAATGERFRSGRLAMRRPGGRAPFDFLDYCMEDVAVMSYRPSGGPGDAVPTEEVSLRYGTFSLQYRAQRADGSAGPPIFSGWNVVANRLLTAFSAGCGS